MRELTKEQFSALKAAFEAHLKDDIAVPPYYITFEAGFVAGLDHAAAQGDHQRLEIAKQVEELQAERDEARAEVERLKVEALDNRQQLTYMFRQWYKLANDDDQADKGRGLWSAAFALHSYVTNLRCCAIFGGRR